jgi:RNA polymerase sigma factor (sigma-70 family)
MGANAPPPAQHIAEILLDESRRRKFCAYAGSRFGIGTDDFEDLLQDTAAELLRYRAYVRSPEGFVFAVFRSRCIRYAHARRLRREVFTTANPGAETAVFAVPASVERQLALRQGLSEISSSCRRLLAAYYLEGRSLREAAKVVSLRYSSVAKTISRCVKKLRKYLT